MLKILEIIILYNMVKLMICKIKLKLLIMTKA